MAVQKKMQKKKVPSTRKPQPKNHSVAFGALLLAVGMLCLTFASVPLYSLFCRATGYGGTTQVGTAAPRKIYDRVITVRFNTDINPELPWEFRPDKPQVSVRVGEQKLAFFHAKNLTGESTKGTAIYNVTPDKAGLYFTKIQCFCFSEQTLKPHESVEMPVSFYVDPAILKDKTMDDVSTITLSYTFFKVKESS
jgi:cytochrome c oxidase assembly protein subunit 11